MSNRDPRLLLEDIIESIEKIRHFTVNIDFEEFINDAKTTDAVVRNFEIIGEAANKIPPEIKQFGPTLAGFICTAYKSSTQ
jgi:uncharacterized protein with HEPN domain